MRLGIISDCLHVVTADGYVGSDNHIFVRQMQALAKYFTTVHICCPFVTQQQNVPLTIYTDNKISFTQLENVGGDSLSAKVQLIKQIPKWFKAYKKVHELSDVVYQRFPNNVNIPGFFYFWLKQKKVFATYTGTWEKNNKESVTYTFQKWLLRNFFRGPVGVYSISDKLPSKIFKSFSPSYSISEWNEESENILTKLNNIEKNGLPVLSMITVGSFIGYKNQQYILDTCLMLQEKNIPFHLYMVGDGILMSQYQNFIQQHHLQQQITITGKLKYTDVRALYREVNLVVQSPTVEGFGKVPIEGYFHGVVPIINNISMADYLTKSGTLGYLFSVENKDELFKILKNIYANPLQIKDRIIYSRNFVQTFTLENWAREYYQHFIEWYNIKVE